MEEPGMLEEGLMGWEREEKGFSVWSFMVVEAKKQGTVALPMVVVNVAQYLVQVLSLMMVGHLGEIALSSAAIASSLATVTGFSVLIGMACALETLCGQAFGAQQYEKLGIYTQRAIVTLLVSCIPMSLVLVYMEKILRFTGQDPLIAQEAGKYALYLIPGLFASAILQPLLKLFLSQSLILPMMCSTLFSLCFHVPSCWFLIFKCGLGNIGGSISVSISYWISVAILIIYLKSSPTSKHNNIPVPLSKEVFSGLWGFLKLAFPSAVMICLEYWSFELLILLCGLLPNPQLETSVLSICLTSLCLLYCVPYGLAASVSTRVSNNLGAGHSRGAQLAVLVGIMLAVLDAAVVSTSLLCGRHLLAHAYSNEKEVSMYVMKLAPLLSLSACMDALQAVLSGVARGCGWQHIGAYVNLGAFYVVGVPTAAALAFKLHLGARGLWLGILCGSMLQTVLLSLVTWFTDWEVEVIKARQRVIGKPICQC